MEHNPDCRDATERSAVEEKKCDCSPRTLAWYPGMTQLWIGQAGSRNLTPQLDCEQLNSMDIMHVRLAGLQCEAFSVGFSYYVTLDIRVVTTARSSCCCKLFFKTTKQDEERNTGSERGSHAAAKDALWTLQRRLFNQSWVAFFLFNGTDNGDQGWLWCFAGVFLHVPPSWEGLWLNKVTLGDFSTCPIERDIQRFHHFLNNESCYLTPVFFSVLVFTNVRPCSFDMQLNDSLVDKNSSFLCF